MTNALNPVTLTIHGKEYRIACSENEKESLQESARLLDAQMRKIHETGKVSGADRIAVLAALNLAHELTHGHTDQESGSINITERLLNLRHRIETVLENN
jgi:cell division protein ZapA